jgi:hypothetical protein
LGAPVGSVIVGSNSFIAKVLQNLSDKCEYNRSDIIHFEELNITYAILG